ncbi:hypothetical protein [Thalassobacillus devorans]|uniref:hypothetical protein n=1 Tax=Thalassobacillus devorans TaxID=279813 RepID=UPI0004920561|nr:hypothetical protein [Thalassobacillus devorans]
MEAFMDYFGGIGFLDVLFFYFPIGVVIISALLTLLFRKTFVPVIVVLVLFGTFFIYSYSQLNTSYVDFLVALIGYIIIAFLIGKFTQKVIVKYNSILH